MSYYCSYLLNWDPESPTMWEVAQALALGAAETSAEDLAKASNDPGWLEMLTHRWEDTLNGSETSGWDECQTDLLMVSRLWPECLFALYVTGDSDDDRCVEYYKNGQTHQGPRRSPTRPSTRTSSRPRPTASGSALRRSHLPPCSCTGECWSASLRRAIA